MSAKLVESTLELMSELDAAGHKLVVAEFYARWWVRRDTLNQDPLYVTTNLI